MWQVGLRALRPGRWWRLLVRVSSLERRARGDARHTSEDVYPALRRRLVRRFGPDLSGLRVLDFGAGPAAPLTALLRRDGALALGVDLCTPLAAGIMTALRENPGRRVATTLAYLQERRMVHHLRRLAGVSGDPPLIRYGGGRLPFEDGSFDCVVSNAVLQELPAAELALYAAELRRVLGPGGVIDLTWHNFFSLSGNYLSPAQNQQRPWGHLLGGAYDPSLNGCTPDEILRAFAPYFDDLQALGMDHAHHLMGQDPDYQPEGADLLDPALAARLAGVPRAWVLTRGFVLQGRRGAGPLRSTPRRHARHRWPRRLARGQTKKSGSSGLPGTTAY